MDADIEAEMCQMLKETVASTNEGVQADKVTCELTKVEDEENTTSAMRYTASMSYGTSPFSTLQLLSIPEPLI